MDPDQILQSIDSERQVIKGSPSLAHAASRENLLRAWDKVRRNNGAAGVDRVTIVELEPQFPGLVQQLVDTLVAGRYRPKPVLRVEVPKPSGGTRKLGIPTVIDRVVQQAVVQVLQPVFEPEFSAQSFAYRPGRGPLDAVRHIQERLSPRSGWVLHLDVENFFDSVPHDRVLAVVSSHVNDPALMALVHDTLGCGVFDNGCVTATAQGVAQGSPLSPLLANAVLDALDQWLEARGAVFARYADDCAVLVDSAAEGERLKNDLAEFLSTLSLGLNHKKTTLAPANQTEFLGFAFRTGRQGRCRRVISPEALADFGKGVELQLSERSAVDLEGRVAAMVTLLNSWLGYYGATEDRSQIEQLLAQTQHSLRLSEWRRWLNPAARQRGLVARGVEPELARQASGANDGNPVIGDVLQRAFPPEFFQHRGLGTLPARPPLANSLDYSGRLRAGPDMNAGKDAERRPAWLGDRSWCLLNSRWLGVSLQLARRRAALLPHIASMSFEFRRHQIVVHW